MAQYVSVASRGIALARRPEGVALATLKTLPSSVRGVGAAQIGSWFSYLVRNAFDNEWVVMDGEGDKATLRVISRTVAA